MFDLSSHLWIMITAFGGAGLTLPLRSRSPSGWRSAIRGSARRRSACSRPRSAWSRSRRSRSSAGDRHPQVGFHGFSGHAMLSTSVYPVAIFLALIRTRTPVRLAGIALGNRGRRRGRRVARRTRRPFAVRIDYRLHRRRDRRDRVHRRFVARGAAPLVGARGRREPRARHRGAARHHGAVTSLGHQGGTATVATSVRSSARWKANPNYRPASQPSSLQRTIVAARSVRDRPPGRRVRHFHV